MAREALYQEGAHTPEPHGMTQASLTDLSLS